MTKDDWRTRLFFPGLGRSDAASTGAWTMIFRDDEGCPHGDGAAGFTSFRPITPDLVQKAPTTTSSACCPETAAWDHDVFANRALLPRGPFTRFP